MKRDLAEFTQVVQHDTACTIAATASVVKDKLAVSLAARELRFLLQKAKRGVNSVQGHNPLKKNPTMGFRSQIFLPGGRLVLSTVWGFLAVVTRNLWR